MKIWVQGEGALTLGQRNFVGQGGQANVYAKGNTAYKLYHDPATMIPEGKVRELQTLASSQVLGPQKLLCDHKGALIGYSMRYLRDAHPACRLFTRAFREREGLALPVIGKLIESVRSGLALLHRAGVLVVDLNEMNVLVDKNFDATYFIDSDSFQTRSFPATAIMDSIRDRHAAPGVFTEATDWFAFAILSFQLWVGMHPFKGKHPSLTGLDARMKAQVSVLHPEVRVPKTAYPVSVIPSEWLAWYRAVFELGERGPPPSAQARVLAMPAPTTLRGSGIVALQELVSLEQSIAMISTAAGQAPLLLTDRACYLGSQRLCDRTAGAQTALAWSPRLCRPLLVEAKEGECVVRDLVGKSESRLALEVDNMCSSEGRVYLKVRDTVLELVASEVGNRILASTRPVAKVLPKATRLLPGLALQNLLGATYASLFTKPGHALQLHLKELDSYEVVDARYQRGVLMALARPRGANAHQVDRLVFRVNSIDGSYDVRSECDLAAPDINFAVLDTGVCVAASEEGQLVLSSTALGSTASKSVDDPQLAGELRLFSRGGELLCARAGTLYAMRMR